MKDWQSLPWRISVLPGQILISPSKHSLQARELQKAIPECSSLLLSPKFLTNASSPCTFTQFNTLVPKLKTELKLINQQLCKNKTTYLWKFYFPGNEEEPGLKKFKPLVSTQWSHTTKAVYLTMTDRSNRVSLSSSSKIQNREGQGVLQDHPHQKYVTHYTEVPCTVSQRIKKKKKKKPYIRANIK